MEDIIKLYKDGYSIRKIARLIYKSDSTISKILKGQGIYIKKTQKGPINKKVLIKKYILERKGADTISREIGRTQENTLYWIKKYGIKTRKRPDYPSPTKGKKRPDLTIRNKLNVGKRHHFWGKRRPDHSKKIRGKKHPNWRGGISRKTDKLRHKYWKELKEWRILIFKRDDYTCQKCKKRGGDIEPHHKKSISKYPKFIIQIENGQTLCKKCHKKETIKAIKNGWKYHKDHKVVK